MKEFCGQRSKIYFCSEPECWVFLGLLRKRKGLHLSCRWHWVQKRQSRMFLIRNKGLSVIILWASFSMGRFAFTCAYRWARTISRIQNCKRSKYLFILLSCSSRRISSSQLAAPTLVIGHPLPLGAWSDVDGLLPTGGVTSGGGSRKLFPEHLNDVFFFLVIHISLHLLLWLLEAAVGC